MNWKRKSLILGSTAVIGLCPTVSLLSSCHKKTFDDVVEMIKNSTISEFQWICTHYRNTFCNKNFCDELAKRVEKMGFTVVKDWDVENDRPKPDGVEKHYHPDVETAFGYDMYFDIPANGVTTNYPTLILQAHTDMVCVVADDPSTKKPYAYDWSQGVIPVFDTDPITHKPIMHSKDYKTSLGADDGAGVATILAIAKHWKEFEHGKLRCIFTVDEEDGESGAKYIPSDWVKGAAEYYLSLDGEKSHINWNYSAGAEQACYILTEQTDPTVGAQEFNITIGGLEGGHSGLGIKEEHLHPILIMGDILKALADSSTGYTNVRLARCWDNGSAKDKPNGGSIPKAINFVVQLDAASTASRDNIATIVSNCIANAWKKPCQTEKGMAIKDKPTFTVTENTTTKLTTGLTSTSTTQLANFLTNYYDSKLYYYVEEQVEPATGFVEEGCNIGGLRVGDECKAPVPTKEGEKNTLYIEFFGRSTNQAKLKDFLDDDIEQSTRTGIFYTAIDKAFTDRQADGQLKRIAYNDPWEKNDEDKMQFIIHEASKHYNNELVDEPVFGWLEIAEVVAKDASIQYGIIGPEITDLHKPAERIDLESLTLMNKLVIYIMQHLLM